MHICLIDPTIGHTIQQNFIQLRHTNFVSQIFPMEQIQVIVKVNQTSCIESYF